MLIPFEQCIQQCGNPLKGILHIGTDVGSEAKAYSEQGVRRVIWFETDRMLMKPLYEKTVVFPMKSEYVNESFGESRKFESFYKENQVHLNIYDFDCVHISDSNSLSVLQGFGNMFERFQNLKAVYCQGGEEVDSFLSTFNFHRVLTRMTEQRSDAFYVRQ